MELLPILLDCAVWGPVWSKHRAIRQGNNQPVVACLLSRYSREPTPMHLLRNLVYIEAMYGFYLSPENIDMYANRIADNLSCNHILTLGPYSVTIPNPSLTTACGPAESPSQLDMFSLAPSVQRILSRASSTQRSYQSASRQFHDFCIILNHSVPLRWLYAALWHTWQMMVHPLKQLKHILQQSETPRSHWNSQTPRQLVLTKTYTDPRRHQPDSFDLGSPAKNTSANHHPTTKHYSEFPP